MTSPPIILRAYCIVAVVACGALVTSTAVAAQTDSGVTAWIRHTAVLVDTSVPEFRAFDGAIAAARLVGVGESVHDVEQFMDFRFALLKDLVRRHHVTGLLLESGLPEAIAVNDYVQGRTTALDYPLALGAGYNESAIVRRVMEWLRAWNLGPGREHPVAVYGLDVSIGDGRSMLPALDRLRVLVAGDVTLIALIDSIQPLAARASASWWGGAMQNYDALAPSVKTRLAELVAALVRETRGRAGATVDQRAWAERFAVLVQQDEMMLRAGRTARENPRDAAMAANALWLLERLPGGERAVVWAHNAHVQRVFISGAGVPGGAVPNMGYALANALGPAYLAIGTVYGGPSMDSATAPATGSVDAAFAAAGVSSPWFAVSMKRAGPRNLVDAWLERPRPIRFQVGSLILSLAAAFDVVIYFDRVNAAVRAR